jgi:integrase
MPSIQKANEIAIRFQSALADGTWPELRRKLRMGDTPDLTFERFGEIYLAEYAKAFNRDFRNKASRVHILGRRLNGVRVEALTQSHVTAFINSRKASGTGNGTINRCLAALSHMLQWGMREGYLERNPLPSIQKLKEARWEGNRPTDEVIGAVFAELDPRVVPLFVFIRETGCRREEALSLTHPQIDWERQEVLFYGDVTKNGKPRRVPLADEAIAAIKAMPGASRFVFYHPDSLSRWCDCRKPWEAAREAAGYPWLRVHDLRHAFGIRLAEAGCPMHFISEVMGHHSVDFTRKLYAKFSPESASNAVRAYLERSAPQSPPKRNVRDFVAKGRLG